MADVVECLYNKECNGKVVIDDTLKAAIDAYYEQYGAKIEGKEVKDMSNEKFTEQFPTAAVPALRSASWYW